ncbi:MAG: pyridoxal-phosphate dependent enzyme, partial [Desulfuromonadales bacterium]|nr:pyridoxal-phosphate dependent enzyme [Desulfuromonadales bacterium]
VIGKEIREQILELEGRVPNAIFACIGGGSNAIGAFYDFINDNGVMLIGVEAAGEGKDTDKHSIALGLGRKGVLHGAMQYLLQNEYGNIIETHSISAGLDYPGVGPEHALLHDIERAEYVAITDDEALAAFQKLTQIEGIIPALESAHAIAQVIKLAPSLAKDKILLVSLSGRGDKDMHTVAEALGSTSA